MTQNRSGGDSHLTSWNPPMTPSPDKQDGPAKVVFEEKTEGKFGGYWIYLFDLPIDWHEENTDATVKAGQINAALAPLLRKAELAEMAVTLLKNLEEHWGYQFDKAERDAINEIVADYRKIGDTDGK